jgi:hypothetical protein
MIKVEDVEVELILGYQKKSMKNKGAVSQLCM